MTIAAEFRSLVETLAQAWSAQDTELGTGCFAPDAIYMEPPDIQLYLGAEQLRPYVAALTPGTFLHPHHIWFDEAERVGAIEYSFGTEGARQADHGVAVLEVRDGKIAFWREYQRKGPLSFQAFLSVNDKQWEWHIGNYP